MFEAKYVIINGKAIVFSSAFQHSDMVKHGQKVDGAGFVIFDVGKDSFDDQIIIAKAYGKSTSLGVGSRPDVDSRIITM